MLPTFFSPKHVNFPFNIKKDESLLWSCGEDVWGCRFLLYRAALSVGIFGAQTQFSFVVFQVKQLLGVERSTTLPGNAKETLRSKQETIFRKRMTGAWAITGTLLNTVYEKTEQVLVQSVFCTHSLMKCTASSYSIPHSIRARATNTGALRTNNK